MDGNEPIIPPAAEGESGPGITRRDELRSPHQHENPLDPPQAGETAPSPPAGRVPSGRGVGFYTSAARLLRQPEPRVAFGGFGSLTLALHRTGAWSAPGPP
jgi:hypothetical protein